MLAREAITLGVEVGDKGRRSPAGTRRSASRLSQSATTPPNRGLFASGADVGGSRQPASSCACHRASRYRPSPDPRDVARGGPLLRNACVGAKDAQLFVGIWALGGTAGWLGTRAVQQTRQSVGPRLTRRGPHRWTARSRWRRTSSRHRADAMIGPPPATYEAARSVGSGNVSGDALDYAVGHLMGRPPMLMAVAIFHLLAGAITSLHASTRCWSFSPPGRSDGEIAKTLFISKKTAGVHVSNIKGNSEPAAGSRSRDRSRSGLVDADQTCFCNQRLTPSGSAAHCPSGISVTNALP